MRKTYLILFIICLFAPVSNTLIAQENTWIASQGYEDLGYTGTATFLNQIFVVDERLFMTVTQGGNFSKMLYTDDQGATWNDSGLNTSVFFPALFSKQQNDTLFVYGFNTNFTLGIAKSVDLGESWETITIESGVAGIFEFFVHTNGVLMMAGRSSDPIISKDGGLTWNPAISISETESLENIRNLYPFGDYFFAQGVNSENTAAKGLYRMHSDDTNWTFLGDSTNVLDDNGYILDEDVVFDENNNRIIALWDNPFVSGTDDDLIKIAYSDDFGDTWTYKTKAELGDPEESGDYKELALVGDKLMIVVTDGVQTGGNRVVAVDRELSDQGYVNTTTHFEGVEDENRMHQLKANSTAAFGYRELNDPYRRTLYVYSTGDVGTANSEMDSEVSASFGLHQNYPNPFNPTTSIQFSIPSSAEVNLTVYNLLGQKVATLVSEKLTAGSHTINFDASQLSSGVYLYRLSSGNQIMTKKMTLIK